MAQFTHSLCEEVIRTNGKCGLTHNEMVQLANLALRVLKPADAVPAEVATTRDCEKCGAPILTTALPSPQREPQK